MFINIEILKHDFFKIRERVPTMVNLLAYESVIKLITGVWWRKHFKFNYLALLFKLRKKALA
jgi:hypothetical protein